MKALTLKEVGSPLVLEDRDDPTPGGNEVVIELKAASLNRRDYWITQGMYPGIDPPVVLGSDGAGVVTATGSELGNYWDGREVIINPGMQWGDDAKAQSADFHIVGLPTDGTFATHVVVRASQLHERPQHLDWHQAAALPLAGVTAYRAVFTQGELQAGERILITGIGSGVATFALQYAVAAGAEVWVTSSSSEKIKKAVENGARGGFDYRQDDWHKQLTKEAGAPNLIIDSAGGPGYASLVNIAAPGGRIVNFGATTGMPEKLDLFKIFWKQLRIQGTTMGSPADFSAMLEFVNQHRITPIVDSAQPLERGNEAIESMAKSPQFGKLVLTMD